MARLHGISKNMSAFLDMLAFSEGTIGRGDDGYNKLVNPAGLFDNYLNHPNKVVQVSKNLKSTAAGRYQFLSKHWEHYKKQLNLPDFGPESQDKWAIQLIRERKAIDDIEDGRVEAAIEKCRNIWASLPGAGYGQPEHSVEKLVDAYKRYGGYVA